MEVEHPQINSTDNVRKMKNVYLQVVRKPEDKASPRFHV